MATYYTSSTALGGGVGSYADPFTLQEAFDTAIAGDEVRVLNDGTYSPTVTIDVDTNQGTVSSFVTFRGRNSGDTAYEKATISGTSVLSGSPININFGNTSQSYVVIQDIVFDGATSGNPLIETNTFNSRGIWWVDCIFKNAPYYVYNGAWQIYFSGCQFLDNASLTMFQVKESQVFGCYFENTGNFFQSDKTHYVGCVFRDSGNFYSNAPFIYNCTFDGDGSQSYAFTSGGMNYAYPIVNSVFTGYTTAVMDASSAIRPHGVRGCYFYNNTANTTSNVTLDGSVNTLSGTDPLFTNTTNGTEDYTPQSGSPLFGAGQPSLIPNSTASDMTSSPTVGAIHAAIAAAVTSVFSYVANFTRLG